MAAVKLEKCCGSSCGRACRTDVLALWWCQWRAHAPPPQDQSTSRCPHGSGSTKLPATPTLGLMARRNYDTVLRSLLQLRFPTDSCHDTGTQAGTCDMPAIKKKKGEHDSDFSVLFHVEVLKVPSPSNHALSLLSLTLSLPPCPDTYTL